MDPLFPELPEDLAALNDDELTALLEEHEQALAKVESEDEDYVGGLSAKEILEGLEQGVEQIKAIRAEQAVRVEAAEAYKARKAELVSEARPAEEEDENEAFAEGEGEEKEESGDAEASEDEAESEEESGEEEKEGEGEAAPAASQLIEASARPNIIYRRPPQPEMDREPAGDGGPRVQLLAAAGVDGVHAGKHLNRIGLAEAMIETVKRRSRPKKHKDGVEEKFLIASAEYQFDESMMLRPNDPEGNTAKIRAIGSPYLGIESEDVLLASGGLCAPLTPLYDIPDLSTTARPVRDALPSFRAERGGVSVPSVSYIGDITTAITEIEESEDALGGTWATKSCQDLTCPSWTDVPVGIISHCREYGNLNARAWPEGIAHENAITMSAHSRVADARLLSLIKTGSLNVTAGAATLSAWSHFVYAILRTRASIRYVLRTPRNFRLRVLAPAWLLDLLVVDQVSVPFDRFMTQEEATTTLRGYGVDVTWYLDNPSGGTSQAFSAETASTVDDFPDIAQMAIFPEGTWLHLDGGTLELGLVRDSTLNSTNDYQFFGETFESVARIGPTQAARWLSLTLCPSGTMPATGTAIAC